MQKKKATVTLQRCGQPWLFGLMGGISKKFGDVYDGVKVTSKKLGDTEGISRGRAS